MRKRIGISQKVVFDKNILEVQDTLDQRWFDFSNTLNIALYPIPNNLKNHSEYFNSLNLDGFILSGGNNVGSRNKIIFEDKNLRTDNVSLLREKTEISILNWAIQYDIPVIGICRGMQFINSFFDGELSKVSQFIHVKRNHKIRFIDKDLIKIYSKIYNVNSYHNYGIKLKKISNKLIPTSIYNFDEVESFKHIDKPILGLMWHPERNDLFDECDLKLFKHFYKL